MSSHVDRMAITELLHDWALARDTGRWERLRAAFSADGSMQTTWFVGSADEFVRRSREAASKPTRAQHFVGASSIEIDGDRAIAESRIVLLLRGPLQGVVVDVTCHGRFYDFLVRGGDGSWRIRHRAVIYEKDRLDPVEPGATVRLDAAELARYPEGYRHVAYLQASAGINVTQGLPTPNSAALDRLYAVGAAWLAGAGKNIEVELRGNP